MKNLIACLIGLFLLLNSPVSAQQLQSGQVWGNSTANLAPPSGTTVPALLAKSGFSTVAQYLAGNSSSVVAPNVAFTTETTTTFGTTTTFDFSTFINTAVTLTGNITTMTLSNIKAGQSGQIRFIQDGSGSRTTVWSTTFKFSNGVTPVLTSSINAVDALEYTCVSTSYCVASLIPNVK